MTEQELIDTMASLTSGAQAVLQAIQNYGSQASGTVTFAVGGSTYVIKSVQQQITDNATQHAADRLAFLQNFGGLPTAQTVTRNSGNLLLTTTTTFATGFQTIQTLVRDSVSGFITGMSVVMKNNLGATLATITKTINRTNGFYSGVA